MARSQDLFITKQTYQEINEAILENRKFFKASDFMTNVLKETKHLNLDSDKLYSIMLVTFMAAFETSKDNLSLGLIEIIKNKNLITSTLNADKKQLKVFIEEILRFTSPLQYTVRINTTELQFGGFRIPENSKLYLSLASANRDEDIYEAPNELKFNRKINPHLSFGYGMHLCLGATIARKEMELSLKKMVAFLKDFKTQEVIWSKQILMRTAKSITVSRKI